MAVIRKVFAWWSASGNSEVAEVPLLTVEFRQADSAGTWTSEVVSASGCALHAYVSQSRTLVWGGGC